MHGQSRFVIFDQISDFEIVSGDKTNQIAQMILKCIIRKNRRYALNSPRVFERTSRFRGHLLYFIVSLIRVWSKSRRINSSLEHTLVFVGLKKTPSTVSSSSRHSHFRIPHWYGNRNTLYWLFIYIFILFSVCFKTCWFVMRKLPHDDYNFVAKEQRRRTRM